MQQRTHSPLMSSVNALRGLAVGITMLSLAAMTVYAGGHLHSSAAPLQPAAPGAIATAVPATTTTTGRLQLSRGVTTTTAKAVTTTHRS